MSEETGKWKWIDRFKTVFEVVAILCGGVWAGSLWYYYEYPSAAPRVDISADLTWYAATPDQCGANYSVLFKNIGKVNVEIGRVAVTAWTASKIADLKTEEEMRVLDDPYSFFSRAPIYHKEISLLKGRFAPDEKEADDIDILVKRLPPRLILFKIEMWKQNSDGQLEADPSVTDFRWDWACGENPNTTSPPTPTLKRGHAR
jgi:hypothetical protein